jgi:hypothetical protein
VPALTERIERLAVGFRVTTSRFFRSAAFASVVRLVLLVKYGPLRTPPFVLGKLLV